MNSPVKNHYVMVSDDTSSTSQDNLPVPEEGAADIVEGAPVAGAPVPSQATTISDSVSEYTLESEDSEEESEMQRCAILTLVLTAAFLLMVWILKNLTPHEPFYHPDPETSDEGPQEGNPTE